MKRITRWNPTTNGALHLGHVYSLIVNEHFAHEFGGGEFTVRFDNDSPPTWAFSEQRRKELLDAQWRDIQWLDFNVDNWQVQTEMQKEVHEILAKLGHKPMIDNAEGTHILPLFVRMMGTNWLPYPYVPQQTAERVVMDYMIGTTHIIRGEEFSVEFSLYHYFCEQFRYSPPKFIFLPRLTSKDGDISKHCGGYTISEFRGKGYTPDDIKNMLAEACLYWPANGWDFYNMKPNPRIDV